jgi:ribosomal protein S27E
LLLTKEVEVILGNKNIRYYKSKGYKIPKRKDKYGKFKTQRGTKIKVKVEDLSNGSNAKINVQCDECGKILDDIKWVDYKRIVHENDTYYCRKCAMNLFAKYKTEQTKLQKSGSIAETHPHLVKYFVNEEEAYKYSAGSKKKVLIKCVDCGNERKIQINKLTSRKSLCFNCNNSIYSYPEKFIFNFLYQLNIDFIHQLSKTTFEWCNKYRYDFYIPSLNMIIETHGLQHYKDNFKISKRTLEEEQENDKLKEQLALQNKIEHYIVLDCRKSNLEWIKNIVMQSQLPKLLDFKEDNIDFLKCQEYSCSSLVKEICDLWNNGMTNVKQISDKLKIGRHTVLDYLKQGVQLGWCDYDPKEEMKKNYNRIDNSRFRIPVICLNTNKIFVSIVEAEKYYNMKKSHIYSCCKGDRESAGRHPETGEKLRWAYYNESMGDLKFAN